MQKDHWAVAAALVTMQLGVTGCDRSDRNSHSSVNQGAHVGASAPPAYEGSRDPNGQRDRAVGGGPAPTGSDYVHPTTTPQAYRNEAPLGDPAARQPVGSQGNGSPPSSAPGNAAPAGDGLGATGFGSRSSDSNGGLGASGARSERADAGARH